MIDSILKLARGLVRPVALVLLLCANLGLLYLGVFMEDAREYIFQALVAIDGPFLLAMGFWFAERKRPEPLTDPDGLGPPPDVAL